MTHEEEDHWDNRLLALMATILLQGQVETFNGIEIGGKRKTKIAVAVTWAEDILACIWQRDSQGRATDKLIHAVVDCDEPQGEDSPWTVEETTPPPKS